MDSLKDNHLALGRLRHKASEMYRKNGWDRIGVNEYIIG